MNYAVEKKKLEEVRLKKKEEEKPANVAPVAIPTAPQRSGLR